ncbi:MAG: hypothetical protein V3G42_10955 [Oscillospiraceae bacterium]
MKQNVKKIAAIFAAVLIVAVVPLTVYAYLQSEPKQENQFRIGEDKQEVTEVFTPPEKMEMENAFQKKVMVENTGSSDQFVRVYLDFSDSRVKGKSTIITSKNRAGENWDTFLNNLPDNWVYIPENPTDSQDKILGGYFYYTKILTPNEPDNITTTLIEGINTNFGNDGNTDNITDFDVIVYSESVQTVEINTSGTQYSNPNWKDAWKSFLKDDTPATP